MLRKAPRRFHGKHCGIESKWAAIYRAGGSNCFFRAVRDGTLVTIAEVEVDPKEPYGE